MDRVFLSYSEAKGRIAGQVSKSLGDPSVARAVASHDQLGEDGIDAALSASGYAETEIQAMVLVESLKQVTGLELAAVLTRGRIIR